MPSDPLLPLAHEPPLLEVYEVAHRLKCSHEHVRRLVREGKLAAVSIGKRQWRVDPIDLRAFIESMKHANGNGHGNGDAR